MQAVIMAGGKGTRLKELTQEIPKPMIPISNKPVLLHQINSLKKSGITDVIIIVGHLGNKIIEYFGDGKRFDLNISYYHENEPLGTGGALYYIKDKLCDNFILLYGDAFLDIDFKRMYKFHKTNKYDITLFAHPNSHPYDSDIIVEKEGKVVEWDYSENNDRKYDYINLVSAGVFIFSKKVLHHLDGTKKDLEKQLISKVVDSGVVGAYKSTEYVRDMGSPDRLDRVIKEFGSGIVNKRNLQNKQKCVFFDRDGTLIEEDGYIKTREQVKLLPGVVDALRALNSSEFISLVVTNQPVLARGECTLEEFGSIQKRLETMLGNEGVYVDDTFYCPHHPDSGYEGEVPELKIKCQCRKPNPGMFIEAKEMYNIDFDNSYIIGDSTLDIESGKRLGVRTILVKTGVSGKDNKHDAIPNFVADDIMDAIGTIINGEG